MGSPQHLAFRRQWVCRFWLAGVTMLAGAGAALADGPYPDMLVTADRDRMQRFAPLRDDIIDYVQEHAARDELPVLNEVLNGSAIDIAPSALTGVWYCRTLKLSRDPELTLVVYGDFACLITDDHVGLRLQKLTGSQRTNGTFYDIGETRRAYVGALTLGDESGMVEYGDASDRNQVGYLYVLAPNRMRLELPAPHYESDFDILFLHR